jgi:hypothetical protein
MKRDDKGFYVPTGPIDVFSINQDVTAPNAGSAEPHQEFSLSRETEDYYGTNAPEAERVMSVSPAQEFISTNYPQMFEEFKAIQAAQMEMFCRKNMDYGLNNISLGGDTVSVDEDRLGSMRAVIIRLTDKVQRLMNIVVKGTGSTQNESIEDTFMDASVYSMIALIVSRKKWGI